MFVEFGNLQFEEKKMYFKPCWINNFLGLAIFLKEDFYVSISTRRLVKILIVL